jgi:hypothetical protein
MAKYFLDTFYNAKQNVYDSLGALLIFMVLHLGPSGSNEESIGDFFSVQFLTDEVKNWKISVLTQANIFFFVLRTNSNTEDLLEKFCHS